MDMLTTLYHPLLIRYRSFWAWCVLSSSSLLGTSKSSLSFFSHIAPNWKSTKVPQSSFFCPENYKVQTLLFLPQNVERETFYSCGWSGRLIFHLANFVLYGIREREHLDTHLSAFGGLLDHDAKIIGLLSKQIWILESAKSVNVVASKRSNCLQF